MVRSGDLPCKQCVRQPCLAVCDELCQANAFLVAKAGRLMALVEKCDARAADQVMDLALLVERNSLPECIPFQASRPDGSVEFGYAAARWVVDLYRWLVSCTVIPERQQHRLTALLLGFGQETIAELEGAWSELQAR